MIKFKHTGDFSKTTKFFERAKHIVKLSVFDKYGKAGVEALRAATPTDSGKTASSWYYEVIQEAGSIRITFNNSNVNQGVPIAIILQLGHGTGTGGWVEGRDYINPALRPIFEQLANEAWKEVTK